MAKPAVFAQHFRKQHLQGVSLHLDWGRALALSLVVACIFHAQASMAIWNAEQDDHTAAQLLLESWPGDFSEIMDRRLVRVLVNQSHTSFFFDGPTAKGVVAELLREFEKDLNRRIKVGKRPFHVVAIPVNWNEVVSMLEEGRAEIAAASLIPTPELRERVLFADPIYANFNEVVVTSSKSAKIRTLEDLSGKRVYVQRSRSHWQSLLDLNESFELRGLKRMELVPLADHLEQEDILQLVNHGLIPISVVNDFIAESWSRVLDDVVVHLDLAIGVRRQLAWAMRKDSPGLKPYVDRFIKNHRQGTVLGNIMIRRYLNSTKHLEEAIDPSPDELQKLISLFKKYAERYGFDYLMLAAQGYQESRLDQSMRSKAGAVGIMQLLPSTAADKSVGIPNIYNIENNIHAGAKYLRHLIDVYFNDPEIDEANQFFFALAGYNAGPNRINQMRKVAAGMGYDPNLWFENVEVVVAQKVSPEPTQYVRNIYKHYVSYTLAQEQQVERQRLKQDHRCLMEDSDC